MRAVDPLLARLIAFLEAARADGRPLPSIQIALTVGGMLVIGELCTLQEFTDASSGAVKAINQTMEEAVLAAIVQTDLSLSDLPRDVPHIHLKGVEFRLPGGRGEPEASTEYWRAPLDRIDGFCLTGRSL